MKGPAPQPPTSASAGAVVPHSGAKSYKGASGRKLSAPGSPRPPPQKANDAAAVAASKLSKLAAAKGAPGDKETARGGKQGDLGTDVDELARLLEQDKNALIKMRHDLEDSHAQEMNRFREDLRRVKWSYDHLRVENNAKEKKMLELAGGLRKYQGVSAAEAETGQRGR